MKDEKIEFMKGGIVDPKHMAKFYEDMFWKMNEENKRIGYTIHCGNSMGFTLKQMHYWKNKIKEKNK